MKIPISDKIEYDFTLLSEDTVKQFEDKVKNTCKSSGLHNFKIISSEHKNP